MLNILVSGHLFAYARSGPQDASERCDSQFIRHSLKPLHKPARRRDLSEDVMQWREELAEEEDIALA